MATDDSPAKSSKSCHGCSIEGCMAFLILRLWVGLRLLMAGMEKFRADGEYKIGAPQGASLEKIAENMKQHAIILPDFAVDAFINILPFALVGLGILILIGLFTRLSLFLGGLLLVSLSFGLMALPDDNEAVLRGVEAALAAGALALARHRCLGVDSIFRLFSGKKSEQPNA